MQHQLEVDAFSLIGILCGKRAQMPRHFAKVGITARLKHSPIFPSAAQQVGAVLVPVGLRVFLQKKLKHARGIHGKRPGQRKPPQCYVKPHQLALHLAAAHKLHAPYAQQFELKRKVGICKQCLKILQSRACGFVRGIVAQCPLCGGFFAVLHGFTLYVILNPNA